ncbi:NAD(P)-binding protein [Xylariaceae sp. FL0594]|nr:NAD(P)-binding protein [Xylariaceae sp. FL0594]
MGNVLGKNEFPVDGRTVLITGGSRGTGLAAACQLAAKGANVVIVARDRDRLLRGVESIRLKARDATTQRFHQISADLSTASESVRVVDEVTAWNAGNPPDVVWCCAGDTHPKLFVDTPVEEFERLMQVNYFSSLYMAHAILRRWLKKKKKEKKAVDVEPSDEQKPPARHLIFTASFLAFFSFAGYAPYSPTKAALRALSDSLSQEMNLYAAAHPDEPRVRVHTVFPAAILTDSYAWENTVKPDVTKKLEEADAPQTPERIAEKSIAALEQGQELITTDALTALVKRSVLGGSVRGGFFRGLVDWVLVCLMGVVMVFVRGDMDRKVRAWGRIHGASGNVRKREEC